MGSLAVLAKQLGHEVSGSDSNVYPPMSTQLEEQGIELIEGFDPSQLHPHPDLVVIGNAMSRGNPAVEYTLANNLDYCSGPQWLARFVLRDKWVLGVAGTHGKTTTSSMLAWILEYAGYQPGYLIGGVAQNFPSSACLGEGPFFVVEADEYDSAFFDKRSKFIHYAPHTAILNNLEFDHADIFDDLAAIKRQFHHLVRTIPSNGLILSPADDKELNEVLAMGCWTPVQHYAIANAEAEPNLHSGEYSWRAQLLQDDGAEFTVSKVGSSGSVAPEFSGTVRWELSGEHSVNNGMAAIAAAHHVGVTVAAACDALCEFAGVKRRMELRGEVNGIRVYDDFAHHPTAILTTLEGAAARLRSRPANDNSLPRRLIAIIEPRSNTMQGVTHQNALAQACAPADLVLWQRPAKGDLDLQQVMSECAVPGEIFDEVDEIIDFLVAKSRPGDELLIMSNGAFGGIHERLLKALSAEGSLS